jgi:hypothetical protein
LRVVFITARYSLEYTRRARVAMQRMRQPARLWLPLDRLRRGNFEGDLSSKKAESD